MGNSKYNIFNIIVITLTLLFIVIPAIYIITLFTKGNSRFAYSSKLNTKEIMEHTEETKDNNIQKVKEKVNEEIGKEVFATLKLERKMVDAKENEIEAIQKSIDNKKEIIKEKERIYTYLSEEDKKIEEESLEKIAKLDKEDKMLEEKIKELEKLNKEKELELEKEKEKEVEVEEKTKNNEENSITKKSNNDITKIMKLENIDGVVLEKNDILTMEKIQKVLEKYKGITTGIVVEDINENIFDFNSEKTGKYTVFVKVYDITGKEEIIQINVNVVNKYTDIIIEDKDKKEKKDKVESEVENLKEANEEITNSEKKKVTILYSYNNEIIKEEIKESTIGYVIDINNTLVIDKQKYRVKKYNTRSVVEKNINKYFIYLEKEDNN